VINLGQIVTYQKSKIFGHIKFQKVREEVKHIEDQRFSSI